MDATEHNDNLENGDGDVEGSEAVEADADTVWLLETFPEEMWIKILDNISNLDTLFNLAASASFLEKLLKPRKIEYVFGMVLDVLRAQNQLSYSDVLKCRLVHKSWKNSIDQQMEKGPDLDKPTFERYGCELRSEITASSPPPYYFPLYKEAKLNLVKADKMRAARRPPENRQTLCLYSSSNIFPSRRLTINEADIEFHRHYHSLSINEQKEQFLTECRSTGRHFLETVGHQFLHAQIVMNRKKDEQNWLRVLCNYVRLLPNLKSLHIDCRRSCVEVSTAAPVVPRMYSLQLLNMTCVPACVTKVMLRANVHIKVLVLTEVNFTEYENFDFPHLPALHTLSISFTKCATENFSLPYAPTVTKLRLGFKDGFTNWSAIFDKVGMYRESLTELHLGLPRALELPDKENIWRACRTPLSFPHVTTLELYAGDICSLDFMLGLDSLEHLRLCLEYSPPSPVDADFVTPKYLNSHFSRQASVWQLLPNLTKVEIENNTSSSKMTYER